MINNMLKLKTAKDNNHLTILLCTHVYIYV